MNGFMLIRHKVRNFAIRKDSYDAHSPARNAAGWAEQLLLRGIDSPEEVVMLLDAHDIARARAFTGSTDVHEAMQRAGVIDKPDLDFLQR